MSGPTTEQAIDAHFKKFQNPANGGFLDNSTKGRLFGHDFLHTVLDTKLYTRRAEEIVAIYQAVLLGDPEVDRRKKTWRDEGQHITLEDVHNVVMPGVRQFIAQITGQEGMSRPALPESEIAEHYAKAGVLRERFHAQFGRNLGDISIRALRAMPFEPFRTLVQEVVEGPPGAFLQAEPEITPQQGGQKPPQPLQT